jgi:hypothetical protein
MAYLAGARRKLLGVDPSASDPFDALPTDRNDGLWPRIEETASLSLFELSALKNARGRKTQKYMFS